MYVLEASGRQCTHRNTPFNIWAVDKSLVLRVPCTDASHVFNEPDLQALLFFSVPPDAGGCSSQLRGRLSVPMLRQIASTSHDVRRVLGGNFHATSEIMCAALLCECAQPPYGGAASYNPNVQWRCSVAEWHMCCTGNFTLALLLAPAAQACRCCYLGHRMS